jgi:hypothetical protein
MVRIRAVLCWNRKGRIAMAEPDDEQTSQGPLGDREAPGAPAGPADAAAAVCSLTLRDHFRPPLGAQRHWHSFHSAWATAIAAGLNQRLPEGYFAEPNVQFGVEIDVATFEEAGLVAGAETPRAADAAASGWSAPALTAPLVLMTDVVEVWVFNREGGPTLVGAVELVSPANKDRAEHRGAFVSKCAANTPQPGCRGYVDIRTP